MAIKRPSGIGRLLPGDEPPNIASDTEILENRRVDFYRFRGGVAWRDIQSAHNAPIDFALIDEQIAIAVEYDKKIGMNLGAPGVYSPDWLFGPAPSAKQTVYKYVYLEKDKQTQLSVGNSPLFFDEAYLKRLDGHIKKLGEKYDGNPTVTYIVISGFMQGIPMYVANAEDEAVMHTLAQNPAGNWPVYADAVVAYVEVVPRIIDMWAAAFPSTSIIATLAPPFETDAGKDAQNEVKQYGLDTYPGHFGVMVAARYATPAPHQAPIERIYFPKGCQMAHPTSWTEKVYKKPEPVPYPPPPQRLEDNLWAAVELNDQYAEVYVGDLYPEENQPVLEEMGSLLEANVHRP
jgi:hypothetical protein